MAIYNNQSTGQVEENKGIHQKEIWLLKEKKESSTATWIYVRRARSASIFAHVTDFEFELFLNSNDEVESWSKAF